MVFSLVTVVVVVVVPDQCLVFEETIETMWMILTTNNTMNLSQHLASIGVLSEISTLLSLACMPKLFDEREKTKTDERECTAKRVVR